MSKEIDLVLSGSGLRFPVFIGGYKALVETGHDIKRVAGSSGGALIATGIACGLTPQEIEKIIIDLDFLKLKDFSLIELFSKFGVYKGDKIEAVVEDITQGKTFADLDIDLRVIASDFIRRCSVEFCKALTPDVKISQAVRYSLSIPLVFGYRKYKDTFLVDGLVTSNYPIDIFDDNARPTVGLLTGDKHIKKDASIKFSRFNIIQYVLMNISTMMLAIEKEHIEDAYWAKSIFLDAQKYDPINFNLSRDDKLNMIKIGYETVLNKINFIVGA